MSKSMLRYKLVTREDDIEKVCDLIVEALKDSSYAYLVPNRDKLKELIVQCYAIETEGKNFLMVVEDKGTYVGIVGGYLINDHFLLGSVGQEILWWVHKDYRKTKIAKELLEALETWAKMYKVNLLMSHYENEYAGSMRKMYEKNEYQLKEYIYLKEIK